MDIAREAISINNYKNTILQLFVAIFCSYLKLLFTKFGFEHIDVTDTYNN